MTNAFNKQMNLDFENLRQEFAASYDPSGHRAIVEALLAGRGARGGDFIGEGRHFRAWVVKLNAGNELVVNIGNEEFLRERGSAGLRRWLAAMQKFTTAKVPLIPPMAIIAVGGTVSMMMPFGQSSLAEISAHWLPLQNQQSEFRQFLATCGLSLDDHMQIKVKSGVPFICDFSDLRPVALP